MKVLGIAHGPNPGLIVEFTGREVELLNTAQKALEGAVGWEVFQNTNRSGEGIELDKLFVALTGWIRCRLAVNELKVALELVGKATGEYPEREVL